MEMSDAVTMIEFATADEALDWKKGNGGWVFVFHDRPDAIWFSPAHFTPTAIFKHPSTRHNNGVLF